MALHPKKDKMYEERAVYFYHKYYDEGMTYREISECMENDGYKKIGTQGVYDFFQSNRMKRIIKEKGEK